MTDTAVIRGLGWVFKDTMGFPGNIRNTESKDSLPRLSGKTVLTTPYKAFGRMDIFSKLGFSAIGFAMSHAGIRPLPNKGAVSTGNKKQIPLIAESVTGCIETDFLYQATLSREQGKLPSPAIFAYTLPSCFLGEASIYYGLTGEAFMIEAKEGRGLIALSAAMDELASGSYKTVVCGACNSDIVTVSERTSPTPGAVFLVLEAPDTDNGKRETNKPHRTITRNTPAGPDFYYNGTPLKNLHGLATQAVAPAKL